MQFAVWSPACLLRKALASDLARLQSLAPSKPILEPVFEATQLIEASTGLTLNVTVERDASGAIRVLRRNRSRTDYEHNLGIRNSEYVDFWIYHADMGSTRYADFLDATLAFCEPYKVDIDILLKKLEPDVAKDCLLNVKFNTPSK